MEEDQASMDLFNPEGCDLCEVVQLGTEGAVAALIDSEPALLLTMKDPRGRSVTPLMWAAKHGRAGVVGLLAQRGAEVHAATEQGWTALHYAAQRGHADVVSCLLSHGARAIARDRDGKTPVMIAGGKGHMDVVRLLLQRMGGYGLEDGDGQGRTVLHHAAAGGHEEMTSLLLGSGAEANCRDADGRTALHCAVAKVGVVDVLLEGGADGRLADHQGRTPLMEAYARGHMGVVQLLLRRIGQQDVEGKAWVPAFMGRRLYDNRGVDIHGWTPLIRACKKGQLEVVRWLVRRVDGRELDRLDKQFKTALHHAAAQGHEEVGNRRFDQQNYSSL